MVNAWSWVSKSEIWKSILTLKEGTSLGKKHYSNRSWTMNYFQNFCTMLGMFYWWISFSALNRIIDFTTVSASIRRRRLIKKSRVWGGGLLKSDWNFSNFCSKKPQKLDFWAKKWRFIWISIEFSNSGGLIKSDVL